MPRKRLIWVILCLELLGKQLRYLFGTVMESLLDFIQFSRDPPFSSHMPYS